MSTRTAFIHMTMDFTVTQPDTGGIETALEWIGNASDPLLNTASWTNTYDNDIGYVAYDYDNAGLDGMTTADLATAFELVKYWINNNQYLVDSVREFELYIGDESGEAE
mgnify:CR=1 FL=1